jgi:hypothetical protein
MTWRGPKTTLTLFTGILSLIYFATVLWEPGQSPTVGTKNYLRELGDGVTLTRDLKNADVAQVPTIATLASRTVNGNPSGSVFKSNLDTSSLKATELHGFNLRLTDQETGEPISDAEVRVFRAARANATALAVMSPNPSGMVSLGHLPHAQYRIEVSAPGFHQADPLAVEIPLDGKNFKFKLDRAAEVIGFFEGLDGSHSPMGLLRFTHHSGKPEIDIRPDGYGQFHSPALHKGKWQIVWMRHSQAEPDPRLEKTVNLKPGDRLAMTVTLNDGDLSHETGRAVGIAVN